MDGLNFFINYAYKYDYSDKQLIRFHNNFTIEKDSNIYRLKESGFYSIDKENIITSNRYLYYNGTDEYKSHSVLTILNHLVYTCKKFNRIIIFPRFNCKMGRKCTFVDLFNLGCFNKCKIYYVENISF